MMTEEEIYEGCLRGDEKSRRELYIRYGGVMLAIGVRYLSDRQTAEDVLHDVFVNVLTNFRKFTYRGEGSLMAWLKRVMVNGSLDYLRRNRQVEAVDIDNVRDEDLEEEAPEASAVPTSVILEMVASLPDGYRTVFNLYTFEQMSHREIAEQMGINEKSSSSQLFRAKSLLAKKIKEYLRKENNI